MFVRVFVFVFMFMFMFVFFVCVRLCGLCVVSVLLSACVVAATNCEQRHFFWPGGTTDLYLDEQDHEQRGAA